MKGKAFGALGANARELTKFLDRSDDLLGEEGHRTRMKGVSLLLVRAAFSILNSSVSGLSSYKFGLSRLVLLTCLVRAHSLATNHFHPPCMSDVLKAYERDMEPRDWAIAPAPLAEFVPLNPDPMIQAKLAYTRALAAGCMEELLVELGKKYTDLRDAQPQPQVPAVTPVKAKPRAPAIRRVKATV